MKPPIRADPLALDFSLVAPLAPSPPAEEVSKSILLSFFTVLKN
jgi:hypothetical protein